MKTEVSGKTLQRLVKRVAKAVPSRSHLPICSYLLFESGGSRMNITATDLEFAVTGQLDATVATPGKLALPADLLQKFLPTIGDESVTIQTQGRGYNGELKAKGRSIRLNGIIPDDFPPTPKTGKVCGQVEGGNLFPALKRVAFCAEGDSIRPALNGILLEADGEKLRLTAADGVRLGTFRIPYEGEKFRLLVPAHNLYRTINMLWAGRLALAVNNTSLLLAGPDIECTLTALLAEFPEYWKLVPDSCSTLVRVKRQDFIQGVSAAMVLAKRVRNEIRVTVAEHEMIVSSRAEAEGEYSASISCSISGPVTKIAFDGEYMLECLKALPDQEVQIGLNGPQNVLVVDGDEDGFYLIMPMILED